MNPNDPSTYPMRSAKLPSGLTMSECADAMTPGWRTGLVFERPTVPCAGASRFKRILFLSYFSEEIDEGGILFLSCLQTFATPSLPDHPKTLYFSSMASQSSGSNGATKSPTLSIWDIAP